MTQVLHDSSANLFGDSDEDEDEFASALSQPTFQPESSQTQVSAITIQPTVDEYNIFGDAATDDEDFTNLITQPSTPSQPKVESPQLQKQEIPVFGGFELIPDTGLFDDDDDDFGKLIAAPKEDKKQNLAPAPAVTLVSPAPVASVGPKIFDPSKNLGAPVSPLVRPLPVQTPSSPFLPKPTPSLIPKPQPPVASPAPAPRAVLPVGPPPKIFDPSKNLQSPTPPVPTSMTTPIAVLPKPYTPPRIGNPLGDSGALPKIFDPSKNLTGPVTTPSIAPGTSPIAKVAPPIIPRPTAGSYRPPIIPTAGGSKTGIFDPTKAPEPTSHHPPDSPAGISVALPQPKSSPMVVRPPPYTPPRIGNQLTQSGNTPKIFDPSKNLPGPAAPAPNPVGIQTPPRAGSLRNLPIPTPGARQMAASTAPPVEEAQTGGLFGSLTGLLSIGVNALVGM